ncbi:hypothetical protein [Specibacter sp. RAF43]|uniref:hypothetical protein n=1 Tax=Specibacter sp. RAF43 TaxID=3233057 RepID=UPI003F9BABFF
MGEKVAGGKGPGAVPGTTLANVSTGAQTRGGRIGRRVVLGALTVFIAAALFHAFGADTSTSATTGDYEVTVDYPVIGRAGLPASVTVRVHGAVPLAAPVRISVQKTYLESFNVDHVSPSPGAETFSSGFLQLDYDAPQTPDFVVSLVGSWEPGSDFDATGDLLVTVGGRRIATIHLNTWLVL